MDSFSCTQCSLTSADETLELDATRGRAGTIGRSPRPAKDRGADSTTIPSKRRRDAWWGMNMFTANKSLIKPMTGAAAAMLVSHFPDGPPTRWVTRERPKIDRIACPWLVRRFIDPQAEIIFVPAEEVFATAASRKAVAFDVQGALFSHKGRRCSFDAFIEAFELDDPGLRILQPIIRGADTDRHDLAPEAAGLHALSLGLGAIVPDDQALLAQGLVLYDALYAWATRTRDQRHAWATQSAAVV